MTAQGHEVAGGKVAKEVFRGLRMCERMWCDGVLAQRSLIEVSVEGECVVWVLIGEPFLRRDRTCWSVYNSSATEHVMMYVILVSFA